MKTRCWTGLVLAVYLNLWPRPLTCMPFQVSPSLAVILFSCFLPNTDFILAYFSVPSVICWSQARLLSSATSTRFHLYV